MVICNEPNCDRALYHPGAHMTLRRADGTRASDQLRTPPRSNTRAGQVLQRLQDADGEWVNGSELATAECGGSEGLKRLRELRASGYPIEERRHPDPRRAIWQYRLP